MRNFIIRSGLLYVFPLLISTAGIFFLLAWGICVFAIVTNQPNFLACWVTAMLSTIGVVWSFRVTMRMLTEIPEIMKLQKNMDKLL